MAFFMMNETSGAKVIINSERVTYVRQAARESCTTIWFDDGECAIVEAAIDDIFEELKDGWAPENPMVAAAKRARMNLKGRTASAADLVFGEDDDDSTPPAADPW